MINFDLYNSPIYLIIIAKPSSLDTQLITDSTIIHTLTDAGFHNIHSITIEASLTRRVSGPTPTVPDTIDPSIDTDTDTTSSSQTTPMEQDLFFLGHILHNGPQVACEPIMNKTQWDQFSAPILKRMWELEFGVRNDKSAKGEGSGKW